MKDMMMTMLQAMAEQQDRNSVVNVEAVSSSDMKVMKNGINKLQELAVEGQDLSSVEFKDLPTWLQTNFTKEMKKFAFNSVTFPFRVTKNVLTVTFVKAPLTVLSKGQTALEIGAGIYVLALITSGSIKVYIDNKDEIDALVPYVTGPAYYFVINPVTTTFGYLHQVTGLDTYINLVSRNISQIVDYLPSRQSVAALKTLGNVGLFFVKSVGEIKGKIFG